MGQSEFRPNLYNIDKFTRYHFDFLQTIGKGGCGRVYKALFKRNRKYVAIKQMSKKELFAKGMIQSVFNEKNILSIINHDLIANMYCSFQDKDNLYIILNLITGGSLRYYLNSNKQFAEDQISCIITAVEYLQSKGVVHRDIKPENLICDDRGYLRLIDFGISRIITQETISPDSSGTCGYIAPECLISGILSFDADYFSIGIVLYELCFGVKPFIAKNKQEIIEEFKSKEIQVELKDLPKRFNRSTDLCDIINQLLKIKPNKRLGHNGINEIKQHKWFHKFNWAELSFKSLISPFTPKISEAVVPKQTNHGNHGDDIFFRDKPEMIMENSTTGINVNDDTFQSLFHNFTNNDLLVKAKDEGVQFKIKNLLNQSKDNSNRLNKRFPQPKTYINLKHPYISKFSPLQSNILKGLSTQRSLQQSLSVSKFYYSQKKNISTQEDASVKFPLIGLNISERKICISKERKYDLSSSSKCLFKTRLRKKLLL